MLHAEVAVLAGYVAGQLGHFLRVNTTSPKKDVVKVRWSLG